ncbi:MAG: hypothetical protein KGD58_06095 [Candidatus Lokiarchaeota archaeon]|nr:hypothetical protein [Candidatus Lokiarchaeota archaeon]
MSNEIKFKPKSIEEAEEDYKKLHLTAEQKKIVVSLAQLINQYLPISERAIKGFIWRVLIAYQVKYHYNLGEEAKREDLSPADRMGGFLEIFGMLKEELTKILISQDQEPILDDTFEKVISFYKTQFANR